MLTRLPVAVRNLLVALVVIVVMTVVKTHFESDKLDLPPHEETRPPSMRVARDTKTKPTIVESNEDWLKSTEGDAAHDHPTIEQPHLDRSPVDLK